MFKLELENPIGLKNAFKTIGKIVDETKISMNNKGLTLKALDQSHITFIGLELKPEYFDSYSLQEEINISIDFYELVKVFNLLEKEDNLIISNDENNLIIRFNGDETDRTFKIKFIDEEYETPEPPVLNHPTKLELPFKSFKKWIKNMEKINHEKVLLSVDKDYFHVKNNGEFISGDIKYIHGENVNDEFSSFYSIYKLLDCLWADGFSDIAILGLGNDMPLSITLKDSYGCLSFIIAPRIEIEE